MNQDVESLFAEEDGPSKPRLNCQLLSSVECTETKWLWKDRIPEGTLTIIEGDGGRGKSTIVADLCSRWSKGRCLPDDVTVRTPKRILLLAAEDDPGKVLRPRFEKHGADLGNIRFDDQAVILNAVGLDALKEAIIEHAIDVVVIDPVVTYLGPKIDMNKGNDVRSVLGPLVALGRELGVTFLVIRHFNKSRDGQAAQRGAGSVDFRNAARSVLQVIYSDGKTYVALEKSNYAARAPTLPFSINDQMVDWGEPCDATADQLHCESLDGPESRSAVDEAVDFLESELSGGPKPVAEVTKNARDMGIKEITLRRAKKRIGITTKKINGKWYASKSDLDHAQGDKGNDRDQHEIMQGEMDL